MAYFKKILIVWEGQFIKNVYTKANSCKNQLKSYKNSFSKIRYILPIQKYMTQSQLYPYILVHTMYAREEVSAIRKVCRCRHSFSDQKCVVLHVFVYYIWSAHYPPPPPSPPSSIISPFKQRMRVREIVCICALLGLQFGQTKTAPLP